MKFTPKKARLIMQDRNVDIQEGTRLRNVRRRLFQDDDGENEQGLGLHSGTEDNLANRFFEEVRKSRENAKERWNFDFEKEEPLPGRYEWVKVDKDGNEVPDSKRLDNTKENMKQVQEENMIIDVNEDEKTRSNNGITDNETDVTGVIDT